MQECPQQSKMTTNCDFFTSFLSSASSSAQLPPTFTRFLALGLEMSQVLILHKIKPRFQNLNQVKLFWHFSPTWCLCYRTDLATVLVIKPACSRLVNRIALLGSLQQISERLGTVCCTTALRLSLHCTNITGIHYTEQCTLKPLHAYQASNAKNVTCPLYPE